MILKGKVALVTGGGTGIGAAIAERFVSEGARVCITGRRQEYLDKEAKSLPSGTVVTCAGDVSKTRDVEKMVEQTITFGGKLDILVNNAGISITGPVTKLDPDVWRQTLEINLTGPFLLMKAAIPYMIEAGGGSIVNISSLGGLRCLPNAPAYCTSKAALIMLTQQVAVDYGPQKIRCNVICPGSTDTPMVRDGFVKLAEKMNTDEQGAKGLSAEILPLRRVSEPKEIAAVCNFLASDDSSYMTGAVVVVDGGGAVVDPYGLLFKKMGVM